MQPISWLDPTRQVVALSGGETLSKVTPDQISIIDLDELTVGLIHNYGQQIGLNH